MSRQFVIIGLGRLGTAMISTLESLGYDVMGMDLDEELIQDLARDFPNAHLVAADATDEDVLKDLNVGQFDAAAVVIGESMEAGILATANLKELGVPFVVTRAISSLHARVLERIGADRIIEPERDMGEQLARTMASPVVLDYVDLGGDEAMIEAEVPEEWIDKSLAELQLSRKSGLTVLALKPKGSPGTIPTGDSTLREGDVIVVGGNKKDLDRSQLVQPKDR
ncbi:MAG: TrkA family potassium uptake protein [Actinomycetota bacterium]|nr:TrkA family potassium uptake protein [Actinomycetota bacterium]